jgi:hypothetical protein
MSQDQPMRGIAGVGVFCGVCHRRDDGESDFCSCGESLVGYRPLNAKQLASWVTGQIRERDAAGVGSNSADIDVLRAWAGRGQPLHQIRHRGDAKTKSMFRFLSLTKRATAIAVVAFLVGLPGCAQIDLGFGPGAAPKPSPEWAVQLSLVTVFAFLALVVLIPTMIVTRLAIYVRSGADRAEQDHETSGGHVDDSDQSSTHTTAIWRGAFIGALAVLMAGVGLSVDTDSSEWVIPDPESGWIGVPLVVVSIGVLALLWWQRWRAES